MTSTNCCEYSIKTPDDGQYVCPKYTELYIKLKLRNSASCWLLLYKIKAKCGQELLKLVSSVSSF